MKVTKKTSIAGEWAKLGEHFDEGDVLTIQSAGEVVTGEFGDQTVFRVDTRAGAKNLKFNQTTINYLIEVYGDETEGWVGKKGKVWIVDQNIQGKIRPVVYLTEPSWKKVRVNGELKFVPSAESVEKTIDVSDADQDVAFDDL